jgi:hypothetical protein
VTEPDGTVVPLACFTFAIKVTAEFSETLPAEEVRLVDVLTTAGFTVIATGPEVEGLKVEFPA